MFKSLGTLIAARRYENGTAALERVEKAYPKYLTENQYRQLLKQIEEVYS